MTAELLLPSPKHSPAIFVWDGEAMVPLLHFRKRMDRDFVVGQRYRMEILEERSDISHKHQFAWLREAWLQLPETIAGLYPSPEHLRKRCLILAGYYDQEFVDAGTHEAALWLASFVHQRDEFAMVAVRDQFVVVRRAKSQAYKAMNKREFMESKNAVLEIVAMMLDMSKELLLANAEKAA